MSAMRPGWLAVAVAVVVVGTGACSSEGTSGSAGGAADSGAGAGSDSGTGTGGGAAQDCVDTINRYRASVGLPPYARWADGEACASGEAQKDAASMQAHSAFPSCGEFAQNECPGWPGPPDAMIGQCLQMMWMEGPGGGHYDNMTSKSYTQVACGFTVLSDGSVWAAQDFR